MSAILKKRVETGHLANPCPGSRKKQGTKSRTSGQPIAQEPGPRERLLVYPASWQRGKEGGQEGKRERLLSPPLPTCTNTCSTTGNAAADIPKNYWLGPEVVLKTVVLKIVSIPGKSDLDNVPNLIPQAEA